MKIKELALTALLLAIGLVLHQITVGLLGGMKPDFVITMLFVALLIIRNNRLVVPSGLAAGIIAALTTSMPGGQLPNIVDKFVTAIATMGIIRLLEGRVKDHFLALIVGLVGTVISGVVFLSSVQLIVGLPASFFALFATVVIPTAVINAVLTPTIYGISLRPAHLAGFGVPKQAEAVAKED